MGEVLSSISKIRNTIEVSLGKSRYRKNELLLHINQLEDIFSNTADSNKKAILQDVTNFLKKELEGQQEVENVAEEILKQINFLQESVNKTLAKELDAGVEILEVQEEERKRVAMDLHDTTVQSISSLIYKAEYCSKIIDSDVIKAKLELQIMIKSLKDVITEMRNTIYNLRPSIVQENDLNILLRNHINYVNTVNAHTNLSYNSVGNIRKVKSICCMTIFRIVQEACQNAVKYAEATNIIVEINFKVDEIYVAIKDNGKGFLIKEIEQYEGKEKHFGISIMRERVKLLRGEFNIESQIGIGTCVSFHVENVYCDEGEDNDSN